MPLGAAAPLYWQRRCKKGAAAPLFQVLTTTIGDACMVEVFDGSSITVLTTPMVTTTMTSVMAMAVGM